MRTTTNLPDDIQLAGADTNPTLRFPVGHSSYNYSVVKLVRVRASYGWLEVGRDAVRYSLVRQSRVTKDPDEGFEITRTDIVNLKIEYTMVSFQAHGKRNYINYSPEGHWDATDSRGMTSVFKADSLYNPLILQALQHFDQVVSDFKAKEQVAAARAAAARPVAAPPPEPKPAAPPAPPTIALSAPSGAGANQVIELKDSPLVIRGVAMDTNGIPVVTINGAPANMRPQNAQAAEFWTEPLPLQPGDNRIQVTASNSAHVEAQLVFVVHYTRKPPPDPRALSKPQIISLLQGGVLCGRIANIVKGRGIKFTPTEDDMNDLRAAGADDELIQAIQQAAPK